MPYKTSLFFLCIGIMFTNVVLGQQNNLLTNLQQYSAANLQEKVYLHMDKPHYLTGDDIWFKGYVTVGPQNQFSALSTILYVDLINPGNKVVNSLKLMILHGVSIGDMHLPDTLQNGTYHLRAYTNWMRNLPEETFFNKAFTIGRLQPDPAVVQSIFNYNKSLNQLNATITLTTQSGKPASNTPIKYTLQFADKAMATGTVTTDNTGHAVIVFNNNKNLELKTGVLNLNFNVNNIDIKKDIGVYVQQPENKISFMPEGGDMVEGLQSRVAFKMLQPDGLSASGSGYITDDTGSKLVEFESGYAGMGSFYFTPQAGKIYKAVITYTHGQTQTTNLPAALKQGYVLTLRPHMPLYTLLGISVSPELVKNQQVTVVVQRQGTIIYSGQKLINAAENSMRFPLDNFPSGIIQITLFNEAMQPVCERLFFNLNKHTALPLTAAFNSSYKTRQPVTVSLQAGEATDSLRIGSFSASVVNMGGMPPLKTSETGILPGLLLTPELKGYVERPDHYFEGTDNSNMADLDNLILCQGWRRIIWDDIKAGKLPANNYQPEKGFSISGTVTQRNGTPAAKARVSLLSTKSFVSIDTVSDTNGHFVFDKLLLNGINQLSLRAKDAAGQHPVTIKADAPNTLSGITPYGDIQFPYDNAYQTFLKDNYATLPDSIKQRLAGFHTLQEVKITAVIDKKKLVPAYSSNLNGPGNADEVFLYDDFKNSFDLKQFLEGRAMGIKFVGDTPYTSRGSTEALGGPYGRNPTLPMRIVLDGVNTTSPLTDISVSDVASIEILRKATTAFVYGPNDGIIVITTKTGTVSTKEAKASSEYLPLLLTGYSAIRQFYAPDYAVAQKSQTAPDHRTTVFWQPDIITDKEGKATFKFYTSDDKGTYQLNIQGMTADGRPAQLKQIINVE